MNKNRRIKLCDNRNAIANKTKRKVTLCNIYIQKNVFCEMQLRNLRQEIVDNSQSVRKILFRVFEHINKFFD